MTNMNEKLVQTLVEMGLKISTVESCTGGMLASAIIDIAGASDVFSEGFITYSHEAKIKYVKVKPETLEKYGDVSEETVKEMVYGCKMETGSAVAVATTGFAGPGGGNMDKPVGLVFVGCAYKDVIMVKKFKFNGDREQVRKQTVDEAIKMTIEMIKNQ